MLLSFSAPHTPVVPPPAFDTLIAEEDIDLPPETETLPQDSNLYGTPGAQPAQERLWGLVRQHLAETQKPYPNVHILETLVTNAAGDTVCPLCRRTKIRRVDPTPDWSEGLSPPTNAATAVPDSAEPLRTEGERPPGAIMPP